MAQSFMCSRPSILDGRTRLPSPIPVLFVPIFVLLPGEPSRRALHRPLLSPPACPFLLPPAIHPSFNKLSKKNMKKSKKRKEALVSETKSAVKSIPLKVLQTPTLKVYQWRQRTGMYALPSQAQSALPSQAQSASGLLGQGRVIQQESW